MDLVFRSTRVALPEGVRPASVHVSNGVVERVEAGIGGELLGEVGGDQVVPVLAAKVAVAVHMQDPGGKKYLDFHQKLLGGRGQADKAHAMAAAKDAGFDMARLEKDIASPEVRATLEENLKLAEEMGMNGTPSYVIGKQVVVGAVGLDGLKEKIGIARCGKATC